MRDGGVAEKKPEPRPEPGNGPGSGPETGQRTQPAASGGGGHRRGGRRTRPTGKRRIFRWVAITLAVLILGTAAAGWGYYEYLAGKIRKGERNSGASDVEKSKANANGQTPLNILILGSDSRNSDEDVKLGGAGDTRGEKPRADVIMLAHLSADRSNMSLVSIPRDTRVPIPKCADSKTGEKFPETDHVIINETLGRGGPGCTLATVQNLTGVYIDHWLTIDFAGVVKMADAIGGVEVCVKQNVWDHPTKAQPGGSHLKLKAGRQKIYGETALQWLRTRHAFYSDLGRAKAQHMYMNSMMRELRSQNLFTNPARLNSLATTAMEALSVSEEIGTPKKLYDLGMELKSVPSNRMTTLTMPSAQDPENQEHYVPDRKDAPRIWSMLRNDVPFDSHGNAQTASPSPTGADDAKAPVAAAAATIPVTVVNGTAGDKNGTSVQGRASTVAKALVHDGFTKTVAGQNAKPSKGTSISYPASAGPQGKANALAVAKARGIPAAAVKASTDVSTITLVIGADWPEGTDYSKTLPSAGSVPDSAEAQNGADKGCMDVYKPYQW